MLIPEDWLSTEERWRMIIEHVEQVRQEMAPPPKRVSQKQVSPPAVKSHRKLFRKT